MALGLLRSGGGGFREAMQHPKSGGTPVPGEQHLAVLGKGL